MWWRDSHAEGLDVRHIHKKERVKRERESSERGGEQPDIQTAISRSSSSAQFRLEMDD